MNTKSKKIMSYSCYINICSRFASKHYRYAFNQELHLIKNWDRLETDSLKDSTKIQLSCFLCWSMFLLYYISISCIILYFFFN